MDYETERRLDLIRELTGHILHECYIFFENRTPPLPQVDFEVITLALVRAVTIDMHLWSPMPLDVAVDKVAKIIKLTLEIQKDSSSNMSLELN